MKMNVTPINEDKELADLLAAQTRVPAEAVAAKARHADAREKFEAARKNYRATSARASLGQASANEAKRAERAMDEAADELRKAEDDVEILGEKVSILATAISQTKAKRRARVLPDVKAEGERIAGEAAQAFATLARLASESKALKAVIDGDFLLDVTTGGYAVHAPVCAQLGSAAAVAVFLASRTFKESALDRFERAAK
jgi:predicted  nucleic acid-binding Zn-ribbon protein